MNNLINNLYFDVRSNYNINLLSYIPITSKSIKAVTKDNEKIIIKKSKDKVKNSGE